FAGCGGGGSPSAPKKLSAPPPTQGSKPSLAGNGGGGVRLVPLGTFDQPLYVAQPPGDRHDLFVVEQTGRIEVLHEGTRASQPFLDLSRRISCCDEQGLLSMAFAPDYARSGRFYVDYTDAAGDTR